MASSWNICDFKLSSRKRRFCFKTWLAVGCPISLVAINFVATNHASFAQIFFGAATLSFGRWQRELAGRKKAEIVAAMDEAVAFYNATGQFDKQIVASYNADVPTADGNFNGNIRFGKQISSRTALHEIGHILGVGTVPNWKSFIVDGR